MDDSVGAASKTAVRPAAIRLRLLSETKEDITAVIVDPPRSSGGGPLTTVASTPTTLGSSRLPTAPAPSKDDFIRAPCVDDSPFGTVMTGFPSRSRATSFGAAGILSRANTLRMRRPSQDMTPQTQKAQSAIVDNIAPAEDAPAERVRVRSLGKRDDTGERLFLGCLWLMNWRLLLAAAASISTGVLMSSFPDAALGGAPASSWSALSAILCALTPVLTLCEHSLWKVVDVYATRFQGRVPHASMSCGARNAERIIGNVLEIFSAARGHLADIALLSIALVLSEVGLGLTLDTYSRFVFSRMGISLLVVKCGTIAKGVILTILMWRLRRLKFDRRLCHILFYEETLANLTLPLPPVPRVSAAVHASVASVELKAPNAADEERRGLLASIVLNSSSYSLREAYVSSRHWPPLYDVQKSIAADGKPTTCTFVAERPSLLDAKELAERAWTRLHARRRVVAARLKSHSDDGVANVPVAPHKGIVESVAERLAPLRLLTMAAPSDVHVDPSTPFLAAAAPPAGGVDSAMEEELLERDDLRCCFLDEADLNAAFALIDRDQDGAIDRRTFLTCFETFFSAWLSTRTSLVSFRGVSTAMASLASAASYVIYFFVSLALFRVDFSSVLVPLLTLLISLAFALGPVIQAFINSLLFVLILQPFEPGDRVSLDGGQTLVVEAVNMLTSEFTSVATGQRITRRNTELVSVAIANFRHSPNARFAIEFHVGARVAAAQVARFEAAAAAYMREHEAEWKLDPSVSITKGNGDRTVDVTLHVESCISWQEDTLWPAHSKLHAAMIAAAADLGLVPDEMGAAAGAAATAATTPAVTAEATGARRRPAVAARAVVGRGTPAHPVIEEVDDDDDDEEKAGVSATTATTAS